MRDDVKVKGYFIPACDMKGFIQSIIHISKLKLNDEYIQLGLTNEQLMKERLEIYTVYE